MFQTRNFISTNQELWKGDALVSHNGKYKAVFEDDGNFVLYKWTPIWESKTAGQGGQIVLLQADRTLVIYGNGQALWSSNPSTCETSQKMRLTVTEDGRLVLTSATAEIWSVGK